MGLTHCMLGYTPRPEAGIPSGPGIPPDQRQAPLLGPDAPQDEAPPSAVHAGRYGQQAAGTHPTGISILFCLWGY